MPLAAAESISGTGDSMSTVLVVVPLVALAVAALAIMGIAHCGGMQEPTRDMMRFCMTFMRHSGDEAERCASAKNLDRVNDAGAIPALVDVMRDDQVPEARNIKATDKREEIKQPVGERANAIMIELFSRNPWHPAG
jgi:hypothetical protein